MNGRSIGFRLTAWYSAVLLTALSLFGIGSWFAVRGLLFHAVDKELRARAEGVRGFMEHQIGALSIEEIRDEFREHSVLGPGGDLFQVCDQHGAWLYRSAALADHSMPIRLPAALPESGILEDRVVGGTDLRLLSRRVSVLGQPYTIQVAATTHEIVAALTAFRWTLVGLIPLLMTVAAAGGWWISRRALRPVDAITSAARFISEDSLKQRLPVPDTQDELRRLSETLNQMLERLEEAFARNTRFTADASHELRTPVALIRSTAEIGLRKEREQGDYRQALREILDESERTTLLLENLLDLARADAGKASLRSEPVGLAEIVRLTCEQAGKLAQQKQIQFLARVPAEDVIVQGDSAALRRLLHLLLDNAVKYSPAGGCVYVQLRRNGVTAAVEVEDAGVGIAAEDLPHIFERFYRADKARGRESGGAGLGLALANWIVQAHGGAIQAESELGKGSRFVVTLPVQRSS